MTKGHHRVDVEIYPHSDITPEQILNPKVPNLPIPSFPSPTRLCFAIIGHEEK